MQILNTAAVSILVSNKHRKGKKRRTDMTAGFEQAVHGYYYRELVG